MASSYSAGTRLNERYELIGHLGEGSDGEVHIARDEHLDIEVALKLMKPKRGLPAAWTEARLLEQLRGDYLLAVSNADVVHGSDTRFIASPVMAGGDLADAASSVGVATRRAVRWAVQAAHAAHRVHGAGLLHRDIKPGNIYLDYNEDSYLADLGMAIFRDSSGNGPANGSVVTAAPEVLRDASPYTSVQSDIYSLGATLFYLLSGDYPVARRGQDKVQYRAQVVAGDRRKVRDVAPHVTQGLGACVEKALNFDPAKRYSSALDFANAIADASHYRREWMLVGPHGGHLKCLHAETSDALRGVDVCAIDVGTAGFEIELTYPDGRHLKQHEQKRLKERDLPVALRTICRKLG